MSELRKINKCSDLKSQNELDDLLEWKRFGQYKIENFKNICVHIFETTDFIWVQSSCLHKYTDQQYIDKLKGFRLNFNIK